MSFQKKTGLKQIDWTVASKLSLKYSPKLISFYELREGNKLIWGKFDLKNLMSPINSKMLPLIDGTRLFLNRGYGLLIACYTLTNELDQVELFRKNIVIELQKAIIAIGDTLLLKYKKYHFSYAQRLKNFEELLDDQIEWNYSIDKETIRQLYSQAINFKLLPCENSFAIDYNKKLKEIIPIFTNFYLDFESYRLKRRFRDWSEYSKFIIENGVNEPLLLSMRQKLKEIKSFNSNDLNRVELLAILPHMLISWNNDCTFNHSILYQILQKKNTVFDERNDPIKIILLNYHKDGIINELVNFKNDNK